MRNEQSTAFLSNSLSPALIPLLQSARERDASILSHLSLLIVSGGILCPAGFQLPPTALLVPRQHLLLVTLCLLEC